ncbi:FMN-binding protein [Anaerococcus tetradius]|uniref:FMN-binding protein n=1 Tax=Anaerococcus tetradius TaxID=33036 RepID=UPI0023F293AB|nr:FMN-binding protein [Anaerococcus tetradius]
MGNKRLEWISVSSLILAISAGIVFGTISLGSQSKKADSPKNKTEQTEDKDKNTEKHKKDDLNNDSAYTDGVYEGSARGYSSDVTVKVTIKDGKIADIEVVSQDETPEYFNEAVKVLDDIIDANSTDVDSISGATISSEALKEAVQNALQKAEKKGTSKKGKSQKNKNKKKSSARSRKSRSSGSAIGHSSGPARSLASSSVNIPEGGRLKDGTYQGSASGYRGNISVSVSVRDGKIAGVDILSYNDDDAYFNSALAVINRMIGQTSANVDSVSGATYSSVGIINAVNDALNKAVEGPSQGKNNKRKANSKAANKPLAKNKKTENDKKPGSKSKDKPSTQATRPKEGKLKDGTYTGSARGFKGNIGVSVTIKDGKIASVDITTNEDDQAYFNSALGVINKMIGKQSGTVDSISGATYSSVGIMNAVNDAINKAIDNSSSKIPSLPTPAPSPLPTPSPSPAPSPVPTPSPLPPKEGKLKDGTYTGSARGFKGNIGVSVTIKDGKIASVDITTNEDDQAYFNSALGVINKMIGKQSGTVDSISGATYSSVGIMNAVNDAINKAIDDSSSKIPEIPKPNPSLPPLPPQPEPGPGSEEKPGEKPTPSPGSEEKPGKKPTPAPGSEEKPQSKEEKALEEKMRKGELAEGSFDGEGSGYNTGKGKVKTKVVIKDGKIIDIVRDEDSYPDDGDAFRTTSAKIIKFLKDPVNGKRNIAIMKMHMDMVEQIANATDPVAKARELVGDYGANYIKNNKDNPSFPLRAYASYAVKAYLSPKYKAKEMYDAVSGATLSAGGTALSVDAALAKSENDKKTNSNIDKIEIVENKDALIERNFYTHKIELLSNKADSLDLSDLQVKLIYKDKKEEIVSYKDFAKHGLEIKGEDGKVISDKMNFTDEVKNKKVLNATITHKDSKRSVDLAIKFGLYSKDYIKKMEYSLDDGKNWKEIANPALSDENKKNIADKQSIMLKKDELGKQILVKTTTVSGKTYTYKSDKDGVKFDRIRLLCTDNSYEKNNNASFAVFLVISEDKSSPSKPEHKVDPQKPETEASDGDIDLTFALKNLNHRKIDDLTIKAANGVTITSAEGLPDGLRLEGNKILGTIEIADDKFTDPYRQIDVTIHATKDGNNIKKTFKMDLYQDKDRDGVDDNEEGEEGANKFTPTTPGNKTPTIEKVRGEAEPTIDEYKALFNNIPDDGSVNVEIVRKPDMSTKGPQAMAKLKFTSTHVSGVSYKSIAVKLVDAPKGEEVEADPGDIDVNFANKLINHHKIDDVNINTGAGVKVKSIDKLPQGLSLKDGKITGSLDIPDKDFVEAYKEIEITLHGSKSAKNIKKTVKMPIYQDKDRDGVDDSDDANPNAFNPAFKGTEFKDKCIHGFIGDAEPSIDDYKKLFNNIPDDGSVTIDIIQKPNMSKKVSMAKLKFTSKYVSETSTVTVGVMLGDKLDPKVQLEKTIENLTLRSELLNGEFIGYGVGFDLSRGKLKTIVEIEHGDIKKVTFVEGKGYSGMDYMTKSSKAIPYLAGDNGKRNVAILRAHENYVNQIMAVEDMDKRKKKAEELLGKKYADSITDLRRPEMISPIVREFMAGNLGGEGKAMLDAVTGATLTSGGLGQSVDNALRMSAHDKETGNDIKEINIIEPSDVNGITGQRVLKQDRSKALDLSRLKLELVDKNGNKKVIAYKDFKTNGIEIKDRDTGKKLENNTQLTNEEMNQAIIAELTHKGSMRSTDFAIQFETYSDDYIVGMEYKFDGGNWQELVNPAKDANNVSYRQTIKINDANRGKNASFRLKTKSGKTYEYTCTSPITDYGFKYTFLKDKNVATDNPNANFALYITFEKDGASGSKPGVEKPDDESGEGSDYDIPKDAKEVEASDINANLAPFYINYKEITPITITAGKGVTIEDVEGLPEGLDFVDGSISGQLYSEDSFGSMKEYPITIYGKKDGKAIKRTLKLTVYQDKDRDGTSAMDEGEDGDMIFNPTWSSSTRKIDKKVGDPAPTIDDYMSLITNLPADGSVTIEPLSTPNMENKGINKIRMKVKSSNVQKESTVTILVVVS